MATIKTDLICNLNQPVNVTYLHGNLFSQDNAGNTINVFVMDNGEPATIGGTVSANVIRSDGQTVAVSGAIEGNRAYVILPQACYAVPGVVHIIIKLTQNTTVTTIAAIVANVYMSTTDAVIDPGQVIPSIQALMALIEEAVDSIPTDYTGLLHTIAADYSSSKTYKVGDYAWESGVLKRCIVPITAAETYTAAHWTNAVIGDDLTNLKSAINDVNNWFAEESGVRHYIFDLGVWIPTTTSTVNPEDITPNGGMACVVVDCQEGDVFQIKASGANSSHRPYSFIDSNNAVLKQATSNSTNSTQTAPENAAKLIVNASKYNEHYVIKNNSKIDKIETEISTVAPLLPSGSDQTADILNRLSNGRCVLGKGTFIVDNLLMPAGSVLTGCGEDSVIKLVDTEHGYTLPEPVSSAEGVGVKQVYSDNDGLPPGLYSCVVNVSTEYTGTTTSRITFLKATSYSSANIIKTVDVGRDADKEFQILLTETVKGIVVFSGHVSNIAYSITVSKLELSINPIAVIMGNGCTVENVSFVGADTPIELTGTIGNRTAIGWVNPTNQYGIISGCRISDFDCAGILLQDTSTPVDRSALISNCHISHNMVGIYIRKNGEFNKIINCGVTKNYYGSLNRGGNNVFSNCGFDSNVVGMQIDADEGDNQGHGSISNCTFNHSNGNTGYGIIIKGTGRELIGNCQFWYSNIRFQNSNGNVINGCEFGNDASVEITNNGTGTSCNMVIGCMMRSGANKVTIYNDVKSKVINCWTRDGIEITPTVSDIPI